jgi:putative inorganic carbon (HCO3(-)) transporter
MFASSTPTAMPTPVRTRIVPNMPFGLLLCMALLSNFFVTGGHDNQRLLEVAVLMAVAAAAAATAAMRSAPPLFDAPTGKPLAIFFLLGLLGSVQAFSTSHALFEVAIFFLLYLFAQLIAGEIARDGNAGLLALVRVMAIVCALYSVQFWVAYAAGFALGIPLSVDDFALPFANIRFFNHTQTATLPLLILLCCVTHGQSRLRWLWWALTAYWWMAIFATTGRGTLAGMVAGCIAVAALRRRLAMSYVKAAMLSALLGLLAYLVFLVIVPYLGGGSAFGAFGYALERTASDPASGRGILWQRAIALVGQHPWLGVGPMHFAHNAGDLHIGAHPHDWVMQIASEWGLPALLSLCAALILAGRVLLRTGRQLDAEDTFNQAICSALVAGAAAILVDGLVSGLFVMPQSQLAITLFLGCAIGWCRARGHVPLHTAAPSTIKKAVIAPLIAAAAVCLLAAVGPDAAAHYRGAGLRPEQAALNTGTNWPRLWRAGFF